MPEFHYYGTQQDRNQILETIFARTSLSIVSDYPCDSPQPPVFRRLTSALIELLDLHPQCFAIGPFSSNGIVCIALDSGPAAGKFAVDRAGSGPYLLLTQPACKKLDDVRWHLAPGDVYLPSRGTVGYHVASNSTEIRSAYRNVVNVIKAHTTREPPFPQLWIGKDARFRLTDEEALILDSGKWYDGRGRFVRENMRRPKPL